MARLIGRSTFKKNNKIKITLMIVGVLLGAVALKAVLL